MTVQNVSIHCETLETSVQQSDTTGRTAVKSWIIALAVALIAFSVLCRLYHLNEKLFWFDEEGTVLLVGPRHIISREFIARPMVADQWRKLEQVDRSAPITQVLDNLRLKKVPDQAPIYYLATRVWTQLFGHTPGDIRLLSVIFSLLALPLVFALSMELFNSRTVSWLSLAIFSASPLNMLYAQEARPYSLWLCTSLLLWLALARAHRHQTSKQWLSFGLFNAVNLLTHYSSFLIMAAGYTVTLARRRSAVAKGLVLATIATAALSLPWLLYTGFGCFRSDSVEWLRQPTSFSHYVVLCLENAGKVVVDMPISSRWLKLFDIFLVLSLFIPALVLARKETSDGGRAVLHSAAVYLLLLATADLVFGGIRLLILRYLIPVVSIAQLCLAYYVGHMLQMKRRTGIILLSLLVACGVVSCLLIAGSDTWWTKEYQGHDPRAIASFLNGKEHPLWIDIDSYEVTLLSRLVSSSVLLELADPQHYNIPPDLTDTFVCDRQGKLLRAICSDGRWVARPIPFCRHLWGLSRCTGAGGAKLNGSRDERSR